MEFKTRFTWGCVHIGSYLTVLFSSSFQGPRVPMVTVHNTTDTQSKNGLVSCIFKRKVARQDTEA